MRQPRARRSWSLEEIEKKLILVQIQFNFKKPERAVQRKLCQSETSRKRQQSRKVFFTMRELRIIIT